MKNLITGCCILLLSGIAACKSSDNGSEKSTCIDPAKIKTDMFCAEVYEPVCGCDGKTYPNACEADHAGVTSYTKGECK